MVIKECILKASEILRASGTETGVLDARVLLCHVLGKSDVYIITNPDEKVSDAHSIKFFELVERRANDEPVAYITGEKEFMSLSFYVDKNVLVPRPDTEHLAELAIELVNKYNIHNVADFCTGSGAIAISIGKNCPDALITGYDISHDALSVAQKNKERLTADNVNFMSLDVLKDLKNINCKYEIVVSNPPYISREEMKELDKTVNFYEPHLALYGGVDGLDFYKVISDQGKYFLEENGILAFEVGHTQADDVANIMEKNFKDIQIKKDYADIERIVWGILK